jgi:hypothetical protein
MSKHKRRPAYCCIVRELLHFPPISHRHTQDKRGVKPFELAIGLVLVAQARLEHEQDIHIKAFKAGERAILLEKDLDQTFRDDWREVSKARKRDGLKRPAPKRTHAWDFGHDTFKPKAKLPWALQMAGERKYQETRRKLRRSPPSGPITLELSRYSILKLAGFSIFPRNLHKIDAALDRLRHPIVSFPPILIDWEQLPSGQLRLRVSPSRKWFPVKNFQRVPLPFPRSPTALALYLLSFWFDLRPQHRRPIDLGKLYARLGLAVQWRGVQRVLNKALDAVNAHLSRVDTKALLDEGIKVPFAYEIKPASDTQVLLVAISRRQRVDEFYEEDEVEVERPKKIVRRIKAKIVRVRPKRKPVVMDPEECAALSPAEWRENHARRCELRMTKLEQNRKLVREGKYVPPPQAEYTFPDEEAN